MTASSQNRFTSNQDEAAKKYMKKNKKNGATTEDQNLSGDYWNRVAEDAASGYKNKNDKDKILNEDQLPDDHERGDKEPEE